MGGDDATSLWPSCNVGTIRGASTAMQDRDAMLPKLQGSCHR